MADPEGVKDSVRVEVRETIALDAEAKVRKTRRGYLVAYPRVARSGIQLYKGSELGNPNMKEVRVFRPEAEVFATDAMRSFARIPITLEHPDELVDASNWSKYAVGHVDGEVLRDGQFIRVPMMVTDSKAVKAYEGGKIELSAGYTMDLVWSPGQTESGEEYDAVQTRIEGNHIALVDTARGGRDLRIGDETTSRKERTMSDNLKTIQIDGLPVEISDMGASVVQRFIDRISKTVDDERKSKETAVSAAQKVIEGKDAEIATLKKQLQDAEVTPKKLDEMVRDRALVIKKARTLVGERLSVENKTLDDIMKQVVYSQMGTVARDWNSGQIKTSFDSLTIGIRDVSVPNRPNPLDEVLRDGIHSSQDAREAAYDAYVKRQEEAWKSAGRHQTAE